MIPYSLKEIIMKMNDQEVIYLVGWIQGYHKLDDLEKQSENNIK